MESKSAKILTVLLVIGILVSGGVLAYKIYNDRNKPVANEQVEEKATESKKINIYK